MLPRHEYAQITDSCSWCAQVCIAGKAAQAALLAMEAYRDQQEFCKNTGLTGARLVEHEEEDTQVHVAWLEARPCSQCSLAAQGRFVDGSVFLLPASFEMEGWCVAAARMVNVSVGFALVGCPGTQAAK